MENPPRIIRSMAFAPAHDDRAVLSAAASDVDAVVLDLEDLTPEKEKPHARESFRSVARELTSRATIVSARTNAIGKGCEEDLHAIVCPELHYVNIPKAESPGEVREFCRLLAEAEEANGLPVGYTLVRPVTETAIGIRMAFEIASASERICYMGGVAGSFWGDPGARLGSLYGPDEVDSCYLRAKVAVDVSAAGRKFPISGASVTSGDPDRLREFALQTKRLGYTGQYTAARPALVEIVHEVYTPTRAEIAEWQRILPVLEEARQRERIVVLSDDRIYDTAVIERIHDLLALARRLGLAG